MRRGVYLCALLLVSCSSTPAEPAPSGPSERPESTAEPQPAVEPAPEPTEPSPEIPAAMPPREAVDRFDDVPTSAAALSRALRARHTSDLPDADALSAYEEAAASLRWIADSDPQMVVRARALRSLASFSDLRTRAHLLRVVRDPDAHPALVASAVSGSAGLVLDRELRAALRAAQTGGDPRVVHAVQARLGADVLRAAPLADPIAQ